MNSSIKKEFNVAGIQRDINITYRICKLQIMRFDSNENFIRKYYIENNKKPNRTCLP